MQFCESFENSVKKSFFGFSVASSWRFHVDLIRLSAFASSLPLFGERPFKVRARGERTGFNVQECPDRPGKSFHLANTLLSCPYQRLTDNLCLTTANRTEAFEQCFTAIDQLNALRLNDDDSQEHADGPRSEVTRDGDSIPHRIRELKRLCVGGESNRIKVEAGGNLIRLTFPSFPCPQLGIPDSGHIRSTAYRHLLDFPSPSVIVERYSAFVDEISSRINALPRPEPNDLELKEDKLLREIQRDVERTFGGLDFFSSVETESSIVEEDAMWKRLSTLDGVDQERVQRMRETSIIPTSTSLDQLVETNPSPLPHPVDVDTSVNVIPPTPIAPSPDAPLIASLSVRSKLLRPLFIWSSLNVGIGYVQGMNSVIAVFWWVFKDTENPEALAFFALGSVLAQLRDLYTRSLDGTISPNLSPASRTRRQSASTVHLTPTGLAATLSRFTSLLAFLDPSLQAALSSKGVEPAHYVFRWITTLYANDFSLPDLLRIWDRIFVFYPSSHTSSSTEPEALSPILAHLLDIGLGTVLMERPALVSAYTNFEKCLKVLQTPQIEGAGELILLRSLIYVCLISDACELGVDRLLNISWEIRERRLGHSVRRNDERSSNDTVVEQKGASTWRSATLKWTNKAKVAALNVSTGPTAGSLRSYWNASAERGEAREEKEDASSSPAKSLPATPSSALSPSPSSIDKSQLPTSPIDSDTYSLSGDDSDEETGPSIASRAATTWGNWKERFASSDVAATLSKQTSNARAAATLSASSIASSDAAAALAKRTTNLTAQAQLYRDQIAESAPQRLAKIKEDISHVSGRLLASTGSDLNGSAPRPGSPVLHPFTPPSSKTQFGGSKSGEGGTDQTLSPEFKPLWLSGSARRAGNHSTGSITPPGSKHNSGQFSNPSASPSFNRQSSSSSIPTLNSISAAGLSSPTRSERSLSAVSQNSLAFDPPISTASSSTHRPTGRRSSSSTSTTLPISHEYSSHHSTAQSRHSPIPSPPALDDQSYDRAKSPPTLPSSKSTTIGNRAGWSLSDEPSSRAVRPSSIHNDETSNGSSSLAPRRSKVVSKRTAPSARTGQRLSMASASGSVSIASDEEGAGKRDSHRWSRAEGSEHAGGEVDESDILEAYV